MLIHRLNTNCPVCGVLLPVDSKRGIEWRVGLFTIEEPLCAVCFPWVCSFIGKGKYP